MTKRDIANSIVAVDLFCGVGGLTYGLRRAGLDVQVGIDIDEKCRYPYEANNDVKFVCKSVTDVTATDINEIWDKAEFKLLAGCAPCQPFSTYRQGSDPSADHRWPLLSHFGKLVRETKPDFVTMENVPRLAEQEVFAEFVASLGNEGFRVTYSVVKCCDYGVPQQRRRLVLLASRHGEISLVPPRHADKPITVRDAIGDLPPISAGEACSSDPLHQACELSDINLKRIRASKPGVHLARLA